MPETMLDYIRISLYVLLMALGFMFFQDWNKEHPPVTDVPAAPTATMPDRYVPQQAVTAPAAAVNATPAATPASASATGQLVHVTTDVLDVTIDTQGGDIISSKLLNYPESLHSKTPFVLLNDDAKSRYVAESGLLSATGPDTAHGQAVYSVDQTQYQLGANKDLTVTLSWHNPQGLEVQKRYTFTRGSYEVGLSYDITNQSSAAWQGNAYAQLVRTDTPPPSQGGLVNLATYFGAAISSPDKPFEKISFKDMHSETLNRSIKDGWAAMIQHYFITAWIPTPNTTATYYSQANPNGMYTIGMMGPALAVPPGEKLSTTMKLYSGPSIADQLEKVAPSLKLTIDYGWFWFISGIIFWMMQKIYDVVGNWGWSIVIVTILIKLLFYQLSAKSYRSMSVMKKLQPRIEMLKERYGDDRQKLTQATLELYREEKVNPLSGCLPIVIQIPVFIALYWVLVESVQLRQAPFILWIHDLSMRDPYYVLPILMGISMFLQQRLNPPPADPMQAKVMMLMPVIFTVLFMNFPAGLMLYWFVNQTLSFLQQWYIMHSINSATPHKK